MVPTTKLPVTFTITVERGHPASLVRVLSDTAPKQRAGYLGPLAEHEPLLERLRLEGSFRSRMLGAQASYGEVESWRALLQVPADDSELVVQGIERLLDGDPSLVMAYLSSPSPGYQDGAKPFTSPTPVR